jgi:microcompartment protein CcmK/EutM
MLLARVVGTVVASRKEEDLESIKLLLIRPCDAAGSPTGAPLVAADAVGAGSGEVVLYAAGSSARQTRVTKDRPVDATIMAIVDLVEIDGKTTYDKAVSP